MTKLFNVVKIDAELSLLVDEDAKPEGLVHAPDTSLFTGFAFGQPSQEVMNKATKDTGMVFWKIVGTIGKRIEGLPVVIEEDDDKAIQKEAQAWAEENWSSTNLTRQVLMAIGYEAGYKSAQGKTPYKDILEWLSKIQPDQDISYDYEHGYHDAIQVMKDRIEKELVTEKKEPVSVELIIGELCDSEFQKTGETAIAITNQPDNSITPVKVNYK